MVDLLAWQVVRFRYAEEMNAASPYISGQSYQSHTPSCNEYYQGLIVLDVILVQRNNETETYVAHRCGLGKVFFFFSRSGLKQVHSPSSNKCSLLIGTIRDLLHPFDKYLRTTMKTTRRQKKQ